MQIDDEIDRLSLGYFLYGVFDEEHFGLAQGVWTQPAAVEVVPCEIASIVSDGHSINVHHRKDEDVEAPQHKFHLLVVPQQLEQHLLANERSRGLSRVLPSHDDQGLLGNPVGVFRIDFHQRNGPPHYSASHGGDFHFGVAFKGLQKFPKVVQIVRYAVGKLHLILFNSEIILKTQCFVIFSGVVLVVELVFLVRDVEPSPSPHSFAAFFAFFRSSYWLHSHVVQRLGLVLTIFTVTKLTMLKRATKL
jgi:hypothetical protein